jgi:hypothetical protein
MNTKIRILAMLLTAFTALTNASFYADCTYTKYNAMGTSWGSGTDYIMVGEYSGFTPSYSVLKFDISEYTEEVANPVYLKFEKYFKASGMFDNTSASNPLTISVRAALSDVSSWSGLETSQISLTACDVVEIGADGSYYLDVTDIVNEWIATGNNYGLVLATDDCPSGNSFTYIYGINNNEGPAPVLTAINEQPFYALPWLPDWTAEAGYTTQFWTMLPVEGSQPAQPLEADYFTFNGYGTAQLSWSDSAGSMVAWQDYVMGGHPDWAIGSYGGMVDMSGGHFDITAAVPTGDQQGTLKVFVQYDWYQYSGAQLSASISGAVDVTPDFYYSYQIGQSSSGNPWMRSTQVFELTENPGNIAVEFAASGFVVVIDSFSVTTAIDAAIPDEPLRNSNDYDLDGVVGFTDLAFWAQSWLDTSSYVYPH